VSTVRSPDRTNRPRGRLRRRVLALGVVLLLPACGGSDVVALGPGDAGDRIELTVGEELTIALPGNPSTGYAWRVDEVEATILAPEGEPVHAEPQDGQVGVPGVTTFRFGAIGAGETGLRLVYDRSFEDAPPEETFVLTVVVG
jgi:inhibitor of cysteine peptidase